MEAVDYEKNFDEYVNRMIDDPQNPSSPSSPVLHKRVGGLTGSD